jgi:hypothetical protein
MCEGKINLAARSSGVDVKTLYRKMREHGLDKRVFKRQGQDILEKNHDTPMNGRAPADAHADHFAS